MTPREIAACMKVYASEVSLQNARAGTVAAAIYNVNRRKRSDKFLTWRDFFEPIDCAQKKKAPLTPREQLILARSAEILCKPRKHAKPR